MNDTLVIGGGPAGLQLGYFLQKAGRAYTILEAGQTAGCFFEQFPRHRQLLSINKIYTGYDGREINFRWDWNSLLGDEESPVFPDYSKEYFPHADDLCRYFQGYAEAHELKIEYGARAVRVSRGEDGFTVETEDGRTFHGKRLVMATGVSKPYIPDIPGIEHAEDYTEVSVDPQDFAGQRVLIVGKGNSAFETAENLIATASRIHLASPRSVRMAWQSHFVGHLRAVNNNILDTYQLKSQNALLDGEIDRIEKVGDEIRVHFIYAHAHGETEMLAYDRLITCTGFRFDASIFDEDCRPEMTINGRFPAQTSCWRSTNVEDLYFAGTITQERDFKKSTSAFIHGFRYNARALYRHLEMAHHGEPWPHRTEPLGPETLRNLVIERINRTAALWHQFGFLCDVVSVSRDEGVVRYYEEVQKDFVLDTGFGGDEVYLVTLEYGEGELKDPFNVVRVKRTDVEKSDESQFLHPIVRHYQGGELVDEHHVIEDLFSEWQEEEHLLPLLEYFESKLGATAA